MPLLPRDKKDTYDTDARRAIAITLGCVFGVLALLLLLVLIYRKRNSGGTRTAEIHEQRRRSYMVPIQQPSRWNRSSDGGDEEEVGLVGYFCGSCFGHGRFGDDKNGRDSRSRRMHGRWIEYPVNYGGGYTNYPDGGGGRGGGGPSGGFGGGGGRVGGYLRTPYHLAHRPGRDYHDRRARRPRGKTKRPKSRAVRTRRLNVDIAVPPAVVLQPPVVLASQYPQQPPRNGVYVQPIPLGPVQTSPGPEYQPATHISRPQTPGPSYQFPPYEFPPNPPTPAPPPPPSSSSPSPPSSPAQYPMDSGDPFPPLGSDPFPTIPKQTPTLRLLQTPLPPAIPTPLLPSFIHSHSPPLSSSSVSPSAPSDDDVLLGISRRLSRPSLNAVIIDRPSSQPTDIHIPPTTSPSGTYHHLGRTAVSSDTSSDSYHQPTDIHIPPTTSPSSVYHHLGRTVVFSDTSSDSYDPSTDTTGAAIDYAEGRERDIVGDIWRADPDVVIREEYPHPHPGDLADFSSTRPQSMTSDNTDDTVIPHTGLRPGWGQTFSRATSRLLRRTSSLSTRTVRTFRERERERDGGDNCLPRLHNGRPGRQLETDSYAGSIRSVASFKTASSGGRSYSARYQSNGEDADSGHIFTMPLSSTLDTAGRTQSTESSEASFPTPYQLPLPTSPLSIGWLSASTPTDSSVDEPRSPWSSPSTINLDRPCPPAPPPSRASSAREQSWLSSTTNAASSTSSGGDSWYSPSGTDTSGTNAASVVSSFLPIPSPEPQTPFLVPFHLLNPSGAGTSRSSSNRSRPSSRVAPPPSQQEGRSNGDTSSISTRPASKLPPEETQPGSPSTESTAILCLPRSRRSSVHPAAPHVPQPPQRSNSAPHSPAQSERGAAEVRRPRLKRARSRYSDLRPTVESVVDSADERGGSGGGVGIGGGVGDEGRQELLLV